MGWWGHDILDGDTPLDCKGEICEDILGMGEDYYELGDEAFYKAFRTRFNMVTMRKKLATAVNKRNKRTWQDDADDARIFCQVAAHFVMVNNHTHDEFNPIVQAGRTAADREREGVDEAGWSEPMTRFNFLTAFIKRCDEALGNDTEGELEVESTQDEFAMAVEALVPLAVTDCFTHFTPDEHTGADDLCGEIHDRIMRMLDGAGLLEAVEETLDEKLGESDKQGDDEVTVTFLVNKVHKINERKRSLTAELRRVQENSEVGLTLKEFDIK
jgi:hypothetical protein